LSSVFLQSAVQAVLPVFGVIFPEAQKVQPSPVLAAILPEPQATQKVDAVCLVFPVLLEKEPQETPNKPHQLFV
jgi:hypothetical protein